MVNSGIEFVKSIAPHREKMVTVIMSCNFDGEGRRGGMGKKVIYVEETLREKYDLCREDI